MESPLSVCRLQILNLNCSRNFRFFYFEPIRLLLEASLKIRNPCFNVTRSLVVPKKEDDSSNKNEKKKKKSDGPKILLENENGKLSSMYLAEAEKLAKKKRLQLISLASVGNKNTYKLIGVSEILSENVKKKMNTTKKFLINSNTNQHDFKIKLNKMLSLLDKGKSVTLTIEKSNDKHSMMESLITEAENEFKDKYKVQKSNKKSIVELQIVPPTEKKPEEVKEEEEKKETQNLSNNQ